jgi:hypothetical protein
MITALYIALLAGISVGILLGFLAAYFMLHRLVNTAVQGGMVLGRLASGGSVDGKSMQPKQPSDAENKADMKVKSFKEIHDEKMAEKEKEEA